MSTPEAPEPHDRAARHNAAYDQLASKPELTELRRRYRSFVIPATLAFLAWYALYVLLSMFAHDFVSTKVVGNINIALILGLLQFVTTFALAWLYSRYSNAKLDPLAQQLNADFEAARGGKGA